MSNYKWVKMSKGDVELRKEDFSSIPRFEVEEIDPILMKKFKENGVDSWIDGDGDIEPCRYVLNAIDRKNVPITAPLYGYDSDKEKKFLIDEAYTDYAADSEEYEWVKETYQHCVEEVASEQAKIFEKLFMKKSLDNGTSAVVTITSDLHQEPNDFFEPYIPEGYIKVCERNCPYTRVKHEVVFLKEIDAKGQAVTIKVNDLYKGLVIGKGGENIKRIAKMINAKRINVI